MLDAGDAIAREEEGVQARGEGEIGEGGDVVICEIDGILVLFASSSVSTTVRPLSVFVESSYYRNEGINYFGNA